MSTTKDKSQGPYNYLWSNPNWIVYGPSRPIYLSSEELCILECERLNAAYQAGQAERDELVKALQRVEDELHKRYAHPDYEYEHSTTGRKQPDLKGEQLESEGWEEYKFQRDEWTDSRSYRRKKTITPNP